MSRSFLFATLQLFPSFWTCCDFDPRRYPDRRACGGAIFQEG